MHQQVVRGAQPPSRLSVSGSPGQGYGYGCKRPPIDGIDRTDSRTPSEIERLRAKVRHLELELDRKGTAIPTPPRDTPASLTQSPAGPAEYGDAANLEGIYMSTAHAPNPTWYGTSSLLYFISRMNDYVRTALPQLSKETRLTRLDSVATHYADPDCGVAGGPDEEGAVGAPAAGHFLAPTQEEYFINLFWESYHTSLLVMDESEFKKHYQSLWQAPGRQRRHSPVVDMVIAISMQYGMALAAARRKAPPRQVQAISDDATIAGRAYYRRCQTLLARELESPTLGTLQCHVLAVVYLCCASFQNMAHSTLALAVRTAQMLGLHREAPADTTAADREMRKRLWWTLYVLESKTCMKLGRQFSIDMATASVGLPVDDHDTAMAAGSMFAPLGDGVTWLSYNLQNIHLVHAARDLHTALYREWAAAHHPVAGPTLHHDGAGLERVARFLAAAVGPLHDWARQVPRALQTPRQNGGEPFSTDPAPLDLEPFAPLWVTRQRLLLELLYHNLAMNLYRPLVTFPGRAANEPTSRHARSAALHARALTCIMHQILTEHDVLDGWHEAFQWQWNAIITLGGYCFAYPASDTAASVRDAMDKAVLVFDAFGQSFAIANSAAAVARDLISNVDVFSASTPPREGVSDRLPPRLDPDDGPLRRHETVAGGDPVPGPGAAIITQSGAPGALGSTVGLEAQADTAPLANLGDRLIAMDFDIDAFNSYDLLWPTPLDSETHDESWYQALRPVPEGGGGISGDSPWPNEPGLGIPEAYNYRTSK